MQSRLLMVSPVRFGYNKQTALTNSFQKNNTKLTPKEIQEAALNEFIQFVNLLTANGIHVSVLKDTISPVTPDSIFPNNIISFHVIENFIAPVPAKLNLPDDKIEIKNVHVAVLYPMMAENRRAERKNKIKKFLKRYKIIFDLTANEKENYFLEGTGSMVFDYQNNIVYACKSSRTSIELLEMLAKQVNFDCITFNAADINGKEIYHTNVMVCIGKGFAVVCADCITDKEQLFSVMKSLIDTDHEIITIDFNQLNSFAGNIYQLFNDSGESLIAMSEQAYKSLRTDQINKLTKFGRIIHSPLYTIEKYGGGSARCMIADIRY